MFNYNLDQLERKYSDTKPVVQEFLDSGVLLDLVTEVRQLRAENEILRCQLTEVTAWAEKALDTLRKINEQKVLDR